MDLQKMLPLVKILLIFFIGSCSSSDDAILRSKPLRDGDIVYSKGRKFAFGFFSLGNSKRRYVGIWYAQVSEQTIVWVANRDHPIDDTSGVVRLSSGGNLCVYARIDGTEPVWSTDVSDTVSGQALVAYLTDLGNLVLVDPVTKNVFWQSFDYPTNTMLPFLKLGFTQKDGKDRSLTSWKSPDDPGSGNFSYRITRNGFPQLILYNGLTPLWRTGTWTGQRWSGVPEMTNRFIFNVTFVNNLSETSIVYGVIDPSIITRMVINETGTQQRFTWNGREKKWIGFWSAPKEQCDYYAHCGLNGYCDPTSSDMFECKCLPGFEPKSPRDWFLRDASSGCLKKNTSQNPGMCRGREGFAKLEHVKIPDTCFARVDLNITLKECKAKCLKNCSCVAYASAYHEIEGATTGCLTWHGGMLDTRIYVNSGQDFYVRVDADELARWNKKTTLGKRRVISALLSSVAAILLLSGLMLCFVIMKRRESKRRSITSIAFTESSLNLEDSFSEEQFDEKGRKRDLPSFELNIVASATKNFSSDNKLGEGGFGSVYKGLLHNGTEIAVKRLSRNSGQGVEEFMNEVKLISKLQHRNLVRIFGCCVEAEEKMLIYEYLPNKSLDYFIFNEERRSMLDWRKRVEIIRGVARGILYLHQDSRLRIIHRDLKASNVLLDNEMNPKIADFGMARIFGGNQIEGSTKRVVGTYGYMSPEYAMDGQFSVKSDVYSFGVLMLEIVTGKKNNGFYDENPSSNLVGHVWDLWNEGKVSKLVDKSMEKTACNEEEISRFMQIGLLCVQESATDRPTMYTVVFMLGNNTTVLPSPKHPAFTIRKRSSSNNGGSAPWPSGETSGSVNDVTITMVHGR
ncbi:PREDICTED: G-type lectin S-receptor-like serine/threonine-protein kinase At1g11410 [Tarenaya hassleriana]|uniref:G-type lectin S-receptor-like serine/threonine-protein kinase At1g11410 n=1 Tax=Tarenaya hassleriana TaxID=28532 RepID=UPI00053C809C|nr:PREDICTED: G-type lectin S-receptor-like serine/threonine-protein kinase At1g11410 [Tarenaya hassleriana]